MRAELAARGIATEMPGERKILPGGSFDREFLSIGLPVVSADGREALGTRSSVSAPEAGSGELYYARRGGDGLWFVTDHLGTWIA